MILGTWTLGVSKAARKFSEAFGDRAIHVCSTHMLSHVNFASLLYNMSCLVFFCYMKRKNKECEGHEEELKRSNHNNKNKNHRKSNIRHNSQQ